MMTLSRQPSVKEIAAAANIGIQTFYRSFKNRGAVFEALDRRAILDAAARLLSRKDGRETSVADIVRVADIERGIFYRCFKDKEAVFRELGAERQRILDAAERLYRLKRGESSHIHWKAIESIAYEAGLPVMTVLLHFEDQKAVFKALRERTQSLGSLAPEILRLYFDLDTISTSDAADFIKVLSDTFGSQLRLLHTRPLPPGTEIVRRRKPVHKTGT